MQHSQRKYKKFKISNNFLQSRHNLGLKSFTNNLQKQSEFDPLIYILVKKIQITMKLGFFAVFWCVIVINAFKGNSFSKETDIVSINLGILEYK